MDEDKPDIKVVELGSFKKDLEDSTITKQAALTKAFEMARSREELNDVLIITRAENSTVYNFYTTLEYFKDIILDLEVIKQMVLDDYRNV